MAARHKQAIRILTPLLSAGLVGWFVYARRQDLARLPYYLKRIDGTAVGVLLALEALYLWLLALSNRMVYRLQGVRSSAFEQLQLLLAASTIERLLPSAGVAGMSSYVWLARRVGIPVAESLKMTGTTFVLGYLQIAPLLLLPLFLVGTSVRAASHADLLVGLSAVSVGVVVLVALLIGNQTAVRWLVHRSWLRRWKRVTAFVVEAQEHVRRTWQQRAELMAPLGLLWLLYPVRAAMVGTCFVAFGHPLAWQSVWVGYSITLLISFLSFLPTTLGVFEWSMVGTFVLLGVPAELATAATVLYRACTFWLPIPFGLLAYGKLRKEGTS